MVSTDNHLINPQAYGQLLRRLPVFIFKLKYDAHSCFVLDLRGGTWQPIIVGSGAKEGRWRGILRRRQAQTDLLDFKSDVTHSIVIVLLSYGRKERLVAL